MFDYIHKQTFSVLLKIGEIVFRMMIEQSMCIANE